MAEKLSSSPTSVTSLLSYNFPRGKSSVLPNREEYDGKKSLTLGEFITEVTKLVEDKTNINENNDDIDKKEHKQSSYHNRITELYSRLFLNKEDKEKFQYFDENKKYTRNLIATDHTTFALILMCWNPGKESPIHDHPCDGCWMRVCEGSIEEYRYDKNDSTDVLVCSSHFVYKTGQLAYITDSMGYHKVGNPSKSQAATTMHLYIPPIQKCKIWLNPSEASTPSTSRMCFHSEYGRCINHES
uniref:Cysteine dioxygenase n=1 Tax=Eucampia antarctica TaxID=49252 RepID=A0A7S2W5U3_9STRA|mmetsp:Transcript_21310/g.20475  ORF Transcript_21310/g.20475 Transcript_21310/m.20475 type:complete len:243 (+) Transcript_21310:202-930(+)